MRESTNGVRRRPRKRWIQDFEKSLKVVGVENWKEKVKS